MKDIRAKLARPGQPRTKVIKKKCDHAHTLNRLETHLKSRDNEYKTVKTDLDAHLRQRERELTSSSTALKSARNQSELLKRQKLSDDASTIGYEKVNELVAKHRILQTKNDELRTDVKSYQRINQNQNRELETLEAVKNFPAKMEALTKELRAINQANK